VMFKILGKAAATPAAASHPAPNPNPHTPSQA
jgi:hypothetical protein